MTSSPAASFMVRLSRSVREITEVIVEADNQPAAERLAIELAGNGQLGDWGTEEVSEAVVQWAEPASSAPRTAADLHDFWKNSPAVLEFIEDHAVGPQPVGIIWRPDGSILLSDGARQCFAVVSVQDGKFAVSSADDAIKLFDAEAELTEIGVFLDAEVAFSAAAEQVGIDRRPVSTP